VLQARGHQRHQRAARTDAEVGDAHGLAAVLVETPRDQHLAGQRPAADIRQRVEYVKKIKERQRVGHAQPGQREAAQQSARGHQALRTEAVDQPPGDEAEQRADQQLAQRVAAGHGGARPAVFPGHEVIEKRQPVQGEPHEREQRQEGRCHSERLR